MRASPLWVPLFFGAGLATGLAHFQVPVAALCAAVIILVCRRVGRAQPITMRGPAQPGRPVHPSPLTAYQWHAALFLAGLPLGLVSRQLGQRTCAATLPAAAITFTAPSAEPISTAGGVVRLRIPSASCTGEIAARIRPGSIESRRPGALLPSGSLLQVTGTWLPDTQALARPGGLLLVRSARLLGRTDSTAVVRSNHAFDFRLSTFAFRTWLSTTIQTLYGSRAPLVDALVTGRRADLDPELKEAFAASGLVHLLSISGFHVGVIAAWLTLILRACGVSRERSLLAAAFVATAYVGFLGWPAPALRAAALAWIIAWLRYRQRATVPDAALALTALLVLVFTPTAVADLGGWLSVLALWGATRATGWCEAEILGTESPLRSRVAVGAIKTTAASIGATVATAPITAAALGAVAPVGIVLNLAAIPLAALAVPAVFASLLLAPIVPPLARSLAAGGGLGLHLIERLAVLGSTIPGGHLVVPAEGRSALPWIGALAALIWMTRRHTTRSVALTRLLATAAAALWIALLAQARIPNEDGRLALHFLDVGQGDAAVIRTPGGHVVVVDAGPGKTAGGARKTGGSDAGTRVVVPFLRRARIAQVDVLVASHGHLDHVGGAPALLERVKVATVVEPAAPVGDPAYLDFIAAVARAGVAWDPAETGETFSADGVRFELLHPRPGWKNWGLDVNDDSVVLLIEYGAFRAVLAGDAGLATEAEIRRKVGRVDLLKVGHHGSAHSSGDAWLAELRPRVGIVSVGRNRYGHPAPSALARLRAHGAEIWRTDEQGSITVLTDGRSVEVKGRKGASQFLAGGS